IMVDEVERPERAVLVDFGLARSHQLVASPRHVSPEAVRHMSPEQSGILDRGVDGRSDLYSLGVVLFECLAGRPPFPAQSASELFRLQLTAPPPKLRSAGVVVPDALDGVVQRLLQMDPRDRYQSAGAALADLDEIADALERGIPEPAVVVGGRDRRAMLTEPAFIGRSAEL